MIIRRYILREIALTLFAVTAVLLLIFFSTRFVRLLADVAGGSLPAADAQIFRVGPCGRMAAPRCP